MSARRLATRVDQGSGARFDVFLVGTVGAVLVTRGYLAASGYPQVGSGTLHVAHVLWGGLAMAVALVLGALRSGPRARAEVALLGGIGFGLFLDEVGKFVTRDVDYFFRPSFAIMYTVVVLLVLVVRELVRRREVSDGTRLVDAAQAVTDLLRGELDAATRDARLRRLDEVTAHRETAELLRALLLATPPSDPARFSPDAVARAVRRRGRRVLQAVLARRWLVRTVVTVLALGALLTVLSTALVVAVDPGELSGTTQWVGVVTGATASALLLAGAVALVRRRTAGGLRLLRAALLIDLLVTDLLTLATSQLGGLPDVLVDLVLLAAVGASLQALDRRPVPDPVAVPGAVPAPV